MGMISIWHALEHTPIFSSYGIRKPALVAGFCVGCELEDALIKSSSIPSAAKAASYALLYGGTEVPPFQSGGLCRGSLEEGGFQGDLGGF
jgi:hypothetical protein